MQGSAIVVGRDRCSGWVVVLVVLAFDISSRWTASHGSNWRQR